MSVTGQSILHEMWHAQAAGFQLDPAAVDYAILPQDQPLLPSSFRVSLMAQASIAMAALAAQQLGIRRGGPDQSITVRPADAERECAAYFTLDDKTPHAWEKFSGLYATKDGHVRIHANFDHHRDGALALLGLDSRQTSNRQAVATALQNWTAQDYEDAAAGAGLVVAKVRSFEEWDRHLQAQALATMPLLSLTKVGEARPRPLSPVAADQRPLTGLRATELTRILAGPICGRTLAAYGAEVMLVNGPHLPNIANITDTSRGKRSCHIDLRTSAGQAQLHQLIQQSHVFVQGYRPGGLAAMGFAPEQLAQQHPGLVMVSLSAYGNRGPWRQRRGFDSLVQTATGFNHAEAQAANASQPQTLPLPILDYASGFLMAFGAAAALRKQADEGGSWHVEVSLAQTAYWLRRLGRVTETLPRVTERPDLRPYLAPFRCTHGKLMAIPHAAQFSHTPVDFVQPAALPGEHSPIWPTIHHQA